LPVAPFHVVKHSFCIVWYMSPFHRSTMTFHRIMQVKQHDFSALIE